TNIKRSFKRERSCKPKAAPVKPKVNPVKSNVGKSKILDEDVEVEDQRVSKAEDEGGCLMF
ncbi:hypothetical protein Tco_0541647, partial [Tanacetum coccineum]